ncbi:MAG: hypothetical protein ACREP2_10140 [Rhodanobacteraceae bacterium]
MRTVESVIDEKGQVRLAQPLRVKGTHRALVTVLDEPPNEAMETALLSEAALSDWSNPEEDAAWAHL